MLAQTPPPSTQHPSTPPVSRLAPVTSFEPRWAAWQARGAAHGRSSQDGDRGTDPDGRRSRPRRLVHSLSRGSHSFTRIGKKGTLCGTASD